MRKERTPVTPIPQRFEWTDHVVVAKFIAERYGLPFDEARASLYNRWVHRVLWDRWTQDEEVQRQILAARA